jgi:mono/diheme cytochrome c family protein
MSPWKALCLLVSAGLGLIASGVTRTHADAPGVPQPLVDFARDVYPVLQRSCIECHGPEKQKGGLRLDLPVGAGR